MLAIFQDVQDRVFEEIKSVYGAEMSALDTEQLGKLHYTEMVIKETMRLFPVGPFLGRECMADTKISKTVIICDSKS